MVAFMLPISNVAGVPLPSKETRRIQGICDDIVAFRQSHEGRLPNRNTDAPADEQRLGNHRYKLRMRCTKALGHYPSERMLNADERAYFEQAVAEAMPVSQSQQPPPKDNACAVASASTASEAGVPPPGGEHQETQPPHSGVPPPKDSASAKGSNSRPRTKRCTRTASQRETDTTVTASKSQTQQSGEPSYGHVDGQQPDDAADAAVTAPAPIHPKTLLPEMPP